MNKNNNKTTAIIQVIVFVLTAIGSIAKWLIEHRENIEFYINIMMSIYDLLAFLSIL